MGHGARRQLSLPLPEVSQFAGISVRMRSTKCVAHIAQHSADFQTPLLFAPCVGTPFERRGREPNKEACGGRQASLAQTTPPGRSISAMHWLQGAHVLVVSWI
jgi:hypothetical protein